MFYSYARVTDGTAAACAVLVKEMNTHCEFKKWKIDFHIHCQYDAPLEEKTRSPRFQKNIISIFFPLMTIIDATSYPLTVRPILI